MHLLSDFEVVVLKPNEPMDFSKDPMMFGQLKPIKLFVLPNGAKDDTPSFGWLLVDSNGRKFIAQITKTMLSEGLARAGMSTKELLK